MISSKASFPCQTLPLAAFSRLRSLLQQMAQVAQAGEAGVLLLTEAGVTQTKAPSALTSTLSAGSPDQFTLLVSSEFSVLLIGAAVPENEGVPPTEYASTEYASTEYAPANHCQITLTFEPEAIASFLNQLVGALPPRSPLKRQLKKAERLLQPNDARLQSEFTLRLMEVLSQDAPVSQAIAPASPERSAVSDAQTLERQLADCTQALQEAILAAQAADRAKSEFLSTISHELRTPLTSIIGMSATLLRWSFGELSQQQRHYLQLIHNSGQHLLELINDILDLSQLESGKVCLNLSQFSLTRLARQTLNLIREQAIEKGIELDLDLCVNPRGDRCTADPYRLQQILVNLLSNAIKFTSEGGRITLRVLVDDQVILFQVQDTGIGISEQQLPLLFQKFHQLDQTYRRQYGGTGLGLALTKQLVDLHGGSIDVMSTVGVGSVFTVRIPVQQPGSTALACDPGVPNDSARPLGRIILIEDHEETANMICDMLTAAGYQIIWLLEGAMAVSQVELLQPLAVITAIARSDATTQDVIHKLRQNPATKQVKILALLTALTETALTDSPEDLNLADVDVYLVKPIQPDEVLQKILALTAHASERKVVG